MKTKKMITIRKIPLKRISSALSEKTFSAYAAQTAFFLMLSFFPFLIFCFALLRNTPLTEDMFIHFLLAIVPGSFQDFFSTIIHDIYNNSSTSVVSITIISAIWLSSKSFLSLTQGINVMYDCKESRNYIRLRVFCFFYSILFAIVILVVLALLVFGNQIHHFFLQHIPFLSGISLPLINFKNLISIPLLFLTFSALYFFMPNTRIAYRYHIPGAVFSTVGWFALSYLYSFYADHISNYSSFYGTMTTIALLMIWLYFCMYLFFLGGFLNNFLYQRKIKMQNGPV